MLITQIGSCTATHSWNPEKPPHKMERGAWHPQPWGLGYFTYCYYVNKVIFSESVQDGVDGVFGDGQPEPLHAATDIHHNHQVFRGSGCLDIPGKDMFYWPSEPMLFTTDRQCEPSSGLILLFIPFPSSAFVWLFKLISINRISSTAAASFLIPTAPSTL